MASEALTKHMITGCCCLTPSIGSPVNAEPLKYAELAGSGLFKLITVKRRPANTLTSGRWSASNSQNSQATREREIRVCPKDVSLNVAASGRGLLLCLLWY